MLVQCCVDAGSCQYLLWVMAPRVMAWMERVRNKNSSSGGVVVVVVVYSYVNDFS